MTRILIFVLSLTMVLLWTLPVRADYSEHPRAKELVERLVKEHGFTADDVLDILEEAEKIPRLVEAEKKSAEKVRTWADYRPIFLNRSRIQNGVNFMRQHAGTLAQAEKEFGVPREVITAIIGVETLYGGFTGNNRILDALATQGFDHPTRSAFFFEELVAYLVLCRQYNYDPEDLRGSYAGAMGVPQFMPSNYLKHGLDYDQNGIRDLWTVNDAIGSAANYFIHYRGPGRGWRRGESVAVRVTPEFPLPEDMPVNQKDTTTTVGQLTAYGITVSGPGLENDTPVGLLQLEGTQGTEYWVAFHNFYVIMSYNPRVKYAMAVYQLSQAIREAAGI